MPDQEYRIQIVSTADTGGFKSAAAASEDLGKQMGVITVSGEDAAKILGKGGEKAEMSHLSMRRLAHVMGSEVPGGAALMEAGFTSAESAMMSSTFLLIAGMEMLKSSIEKINNDKATATKISDGLADADAKHTDVIEKQREALDRAEVAEAEFHHNYQRHAQDSIAAAEKFAAAVLKASFSSAADEDSTRKGVMEREVADMEQRGVISHDAAVKAKEMIDLQYEQRKLERMLAQDRKEEEASAYHLFTKQVEARNDVGAEKAAEGTYATAATAKAANDQKIEEAKARIAAGEETKKSLRETGITEENIQKLKDSYAKTSGLPSDGAGAASLSEMFTYLSRHVGGMVPRKLFGTAGDVNLATYTGADLDIQSGNQELARARKNSVGLDINEGNAKSDLEAARQRAVKDKDAAADAADNLQTLKSTNAIKEQGARTDFGLDAAATALHGHATNINNFMAQVNRLAEAMSHMSPAQVTDLAQKVDVIQSQVAVLAGSR